MLKTSFAYLLVIILILVFVLLLVIIIFLVVLSIIIFTLVFHIGGSLFFPLHPSIGKLFHHLQELLAIVLQQIISDRQDVTYTCKR
jgi:hypothetical protein